MPNEDGHGFKYDTDVQMQRESGLDEPSYVLAIVGVRSAKPMPIFRGSNKTLLTVQMQSIMYFRSGRTEDDEATADGRTLGDNTAAFTTREGPPERCLAAVS